MNRIDSILAMIIHQITLNKYQLKALRRILRKVQLLEKSITNIPEDKAEIKDKHKIIKKYILDIDRNLKSLEDISDDRFTQLRLAIEQIKSNPFISNTYDHEEKYTYLKQLKEQVKIIYSNTLFDDWKINKNEAKYIMQLTYGLKMFPEYDKNNYNEQVDKTEMDKSIDKTKVDGSSEKIKNYIESLSIEVKDEIHYSLIKYANLFFKVILGLMLLIATSWLLNSITSENLIIMFILLFSYLIYISFYAKCTLENYMLMSGSLFIGIGWKLFIATIFLSILFLLSLIMTFGDLLGSRYKIDNFFIYIIIYILYIIFLFIPSVIIAHDISNYKYKTWIVRIIDKDYPELGPQKPSIFSQIIRIFSLGYIEAKIIMDQEMSLSYNKTNTCVFSWDEIPGKDSMGLMEFLSSEFHIDWVKNAKFEKIDNSGTIKASTENNSLSLKLDDKKVILEIDDGRTSEFKAEKKEGKQNIYTYTNEEELKNFAGNLIKKVSSEYVFDRFIGYRFNETSSNSDLRRKYADLLLPFIPLHSFFLLLLIYLIYPELIAYNLDFRLFGILFGIALLVYLFSVEFPFYIGQDKWKSKEIGRLEYEKNKVENKINECESITKPEFESNIKLRDVYKSEIDEKMSIPMHPHRLIVSVWLFAWGISSAILTDIISHSVQSSTNTTIMNIVNSTLIK
jgi:hypothetical protein